MTSAAQSYDLGIVPPPEVFADEPAPFDESGLLELSTEQALEQAAALPLGTRFRLQSDATPLQRAFLSVHGFVVYGRVAAPTEVARVLAEIDQVEAKLLAENIDSICGVPVWFGIGPDGRPWLQRMGFSSHYSEWMEAFFHDGRFEAVRRLIGADARIATNEKDGVVFNRYANLPGSLRPDLAWHTDALRDVFYNWRMPGPMLNVGLHLDRIRPEDGGLRLLPGTHTQGIGRTLFRKVHFVSNRPDPAEIMVETWPGDLTVHDGRMWHRVQASPHPGMRSLRRSMYIPYVIDAFQPKDEQSGTLLYMRVLDAVVRRRQAQARKRVEALSKQARSGGQG